MIRPLSLYIGLRYTRAKRYNHFISFISFASMIGLALGITVLITVLSVMNGFDEQIKQQVFSVLPEVTLVTPVSSMSEQAAIAKEVAQVSGVKVASPYVSGEAMLTHAGQIRGIQLIGVDPDQATVTAKVLPYLSVQSIAALGQNRFQLIISQDIATKFQLSVGDKLTVYTAQSSITPAGVIPRYKQFTIAGIFATQAATTNFNGSLIYTNLSDAEVLFGAQASSGFYIRLNDIYQADAVSHAVSDTISIPHYVTNWMQSLGALFKALAMEKYMMFVILLLIVAVAAFNLVSTLVMVVNEKRADIAILRTLGASPYTILNTFIIQGAVIGLIGTLLGLVGGLLLASHVTALVAWVQSTFHVQLISASVYFVDFLPSKIQASDVLYVCALSFILSLLATIYPAWVAFKTQPAEALRYE